MANQVSMIPEEQWKMPVSITPDGNWISLREFTDEKMDQKMVTLSPENLADQLVPAGQEAALVEKRIAYQPDFQLAMIGIGIVDQERAMQEVRNKTSAGLTLIDIELRTIALVIEHVRGDR